MHAALHPSLQNEDLKVCMNNQTGSGKPLLEKSMLDLQGWSPLLKVCMDSGQRGLIQQIGHTTFPMPRPLGYLSKYDDDFSDLSMIQLKSLEKWDMIYNKNDIVFHGHTICSPWCASRFLLYLWRFVPINCLWSYIFYKRLSMKVGF